MICPSCGRENRPGARFCVQCGAELEAGPVPEPSEPEARPPSEPGRPTVNAQVIGRVGLLGGNTLITIGALLVLFSFMLPWASCGGVNLSGLDIATQPSEYGGNASWSVLLLVPLGALVLLGVGLAGIVLSLLARSLSAALARLVPFLPLLGALPGLCGCCPSCAFFVNIQNARSDPDNLGLGVLIQVEYGFWLALFGLGVSFVGILLAVVGGLVAQRRSTPS